MPQTFKRIDTHQHFIPDFYWDAMEEAGIRVSNSRGLAPWSRELCLEVMDRQSISTAIGSISSPGIFFGDREKARILARRCNEFMAELIASDPNRFGAFAAVSLSDPDGACVEIQYALDVLKLDGVCVFASENGKFLGNPDLDVILTELDRRHAAVFVHPNAHPLTKQLDLTLPAFILEYVFDTTRAAANLIFSGALNRFRKIQFILSHAGGALPYLASRLAAVPLIDPRYRVSEQEMADNLGHFWYDLALSYGIQSIASLRAVARQDRILFGSDWPYGPEEVGARAIRDLEDEASLTALEAEAISYQNAVRLFPRFATTRNSAS